MNNNRSVEPPAGISLGDVYYIIFRHKWKIILASLAGIAAAAGIYFLNPPPYQSQAELLVKYVPQSTQLTLPGEAQKVTIPDPNGDNIINSEIQILTSLDTVAQAVTNIGASNILVKAGAGADPMSAAGYVRGNLDAMPADKDSSVIVVTFKSLNPQIVQPVLQEIINDYFAKHYQIHSAGGQFDDALTMEESELKVELDATQQQLAELKNKDNIISLDDSRQNLAQQIFQIRGDILEAQAELSGNEAAMKQMNGGHPLKPDATNTQTVIPQNQVDAYSDVCASLDALNKKKQGYQAQGFTESNPLVQEVDEQIRGAETARADFENKYPQITGTVITSASTSGSAAGSIADPGAQIAQVVSLQARINAWNTELDQLRSQTTNLNNLAPRITQLEQTMAIQETNYQNLAVSLEQSHIAQALDPAKAPDIRWVQMPSPPSRDWKKTYKTMAGLVFGGVCSGLGWAFLIEFFLDRSVKRPGEIELKLKLPLFLSIPDVSRNGHARMLKSPERRQLKLHNSDEDGGTHEASDKGGEAGGNGHVAGNGKSEVRNGASEVLAGDTSLYASRFSPSTPANRALDLYYEALRDRLIVYFEVKNLTHKPKLVAVTGANEGAGVSTIAAGLAASLSETGEGHVLLVDMNLENGAAQQFYKGKAGCGLDTALTSETKQDALVRENLYVVSGHSNGNGLPQALPKRFAALVPKMKASDFDYIIFDLPVVSPISVTLRVAQFMDMTLFVVESEKSDRDVVLQANDWLVKAGATVSVVLNKTHKYVPAKLLQELPGDQ
ncbi:MAG TPA: Wzz/FepE/Etk N-terminal domain-containing protein [Verrucomicrobiae bacterium]|nr:Wzz/FepE/Etk N-terminal domain-containing protein [Verrucomicrobiae bacterium]